MSRYSSGVRYEYEARDELIKRGYVVVRAAGSRGVIDLVGIGTNDFIVLAVKKWNVWIGDDIEKLGRLQVPNNCRVELWQRSKGGGWTIHQIDQKPGRNREI